MSSRARRAWRSPDNQEIASSLRLLAMTYEDFALEGNLKTRNSQAENFLSHILTKNQLLRMQMAWHAPCSLFHVSNTGKGERNEIQTPIHLYGPLYLCRMWKWP